MRKSINRCSIKFRQTAKIFALSSGNVNKYELLSGQGFLSEKGPARKSGSITKT